jgi:predicted nuclease of restriction endonuclease-like (RecB) superfamily
MNQKKIGNVKKFYAFIKVTYNIKIETALWFVQVLLQKSHRHPYFLFYHKQTCPDKF